MTTKRKLKEFFKNEEKIAALRSGLNELHRSGVFNLLRELGVPAVVGNGSDVNAMAHQGSFSCGFNTCIYELENFEILHDVEVIEGKEKLSMDFGGTKKALKDGLLRPEDLKKKGK